MTSTLLLCLVLPVAGLELDTVATIGVSARQRSAGDGLEATLAYGLSLGARPHAAWPLRLEVAFLSDLHGGGGGGEVVSVSAWQGELAVLGGLDWRALERGQDVLGLELLLGPALRLNRVATTVYDRTEALWSVRGSGVVAAGLYYRYAEWRVGARLWLGVGRDRVFQAGLTLGRVL
jgi:hypothetical protein